MQPALKAWKRTQIWEWLKHRTLPQVFRGSAAKERSIVESLTGEQLEFVLFVARIVYAKGHKDGREI